MGRECKRAEKRCDTESITSIHYMRENHCSSTSSYRLTRSGKFRPKDHTQPAKTSFQGPNHVCIDHLIIQIKNKKKGAQDRSNPSALFGRGRPAPSITLFCSSRGQEAAPLTSSPHCLPTPRSNLPYLPHQPLQPVL